MLQSHQNLEQVLVWLLCPADLKTVHQDLPSTNAISANYQHVPHVIEMFQSGSMQHQGMHMRTSQSPSFGFCTSTLEQKVPALLRISRILEMFRFMKGFEL